MASLIFLEAAAGLRRVKRRLERLQARIEYGLGGGSGSGGTPPLDAEQVARYRRNGYLVASDLIPDSIVDAARESTWRHLCKGQGPRPWEDAPRGPEMLADPQLVACFTDRFLATAAQLTDRPVGSFYRPGRAYTIHRFPTSKPWSPFPPHIDHANQDARHRTRPLPYRVGSLTYLTDVPDHGGGTVVWSGSHLVLRRMVDEHPARFRMMHALCEAIPTEGIGAPIELCPDAGDVLFFHPLCVHAGSANTGPRPRLVLNTKW